MSHQPPWRIRFDGGLELILGHVRDADGVTSWSFDIPAEAAAARWETVGAPPPFSGRPPFGPA